jgi:8-oxo-dGTP diphosphatase
LNISTAGIAEISGKFLLALRKKGGSLSEKWEFPGGKVRLNENPKDGLKREFLEEFGIDIEVGDLIHESTFQNKDILYRLKSFRVSLLSQAFVLNEHQRVEWLLPSEIIDLDLADSDKPVAEILIQQSRH